MAYGLPLQKKLERLIDRGYCHRRDVDSATMDALEGTSSQPSQAAPQGIQLPSII